MVNNVWDLAIECGRAINGHFQFQDAELRVELNLLYDQKDRDSRPLQSWV